MCSIMCLDKEVENKFSKIARRFYLSVSQWINKLSRKKHNIKTTKGHTREYHQGKMHVTNEDGFKLSIYQGNAT